MLNPSVFTLLFQWINFGVLLLLMTVLLYKPILKFLDGRAKEIRDTIKEAEETREKADGVLAEYREQLAGADREVREILDDARSRGEKERSRIVSRAEDEAKNVLGRARESIELEEREARSRLRREAVELSLAAASRLIERELDDSDQRRFVEDSIKELETVDG